MKKTYNMRRTIYNNICALTGLVLVVCILFITAIYAAVFYKNMKDDMQNQAHIMELYLNDTERANVEFVLPASGIKAAVLGTDGGLSAKMRKKIGKFNNSANEGYIDFFEGPVYYYAVKPDKGNILVLEKRIGNILLWIACAFGAAAAMLAAVFAFAWKMTALIMKPIEDMNENVDLEGFVYEEFHPFFTRIINENKEKEKTEKIRREFSANVSHELKTPLTAIYGYAQMINNGMVHSKEDVYHFTGKIEKESSRLILLVNDIIKLSHLDENNMNSHDIEVLDLDEMTKEVMASIEEYAKNKKIRLYYSGEEAQIKGSGTLISELIYNLLDNAIKYNRENGSVDVVVGNLADSVEISVKDTGIGIADEEQERIFERFYRVDKSHSKKVGGTGLGLSIVKHIAMCHNAEINIKSKIGEGTIISVRFPR